MRHIRAWISGTWIVLLVAALIIALDQISKESGADVVYLDAGKGQKDGGEKNA